MFDSKNEQIVLATANHDKRRELLYLWGESRWDVLTLQDFGTIFDIVEDGETFEANAIKKASEVSLSTGLLTLADDSGLEVDALNGEPGIYSARYSGKRATYQSNINQLLYRLQGVPKEERTACFTCCMALVKGPDILAVVRESCQGYILEKATGTDGFGYDPVFVYPALNKTFAEMSCQEKSNVSHRAKALKKIKHILKGIS